MAEKIDYELTAPEDELLWAVTEEAYANAGAFGGALAGAGGAAGGRAGGRRGAKRTKPQSSIARIEVPRSPDEVAELAGAAIAAKGEVIPDPNEGTDGAIWGVVASGTMNMAPALVRVAIEPDGATGSRVEVRATGREALIKQKVAAKAVDRIVAALE